MPNGFLKRSSMRRSAAICATLALASAILLQVPAAAQEVGMFFDENAEVCVGSIENFGSAVKVRVFAFVGAEVTLNGASLRLELPNGFEVSNQGEPRQGMNTLTGDINSTLGIDITLSPCQLGGAPVLLLSFDLTHFDTGLPGGPQVQDLELKLRGGTIVADSLNLVEPTLKLCDPEDPLGGTTELKEAVALQATLNCSAQCPCTVGTRPKAWSDFKRLYLEP